MSEVTKEPLLGTIGEFFSVVAAAVAIFGGPGGAVIARALALGGSLVARGVAGDAQIKELSAEIQMMVDAKVGPTEGEWARLFARHEAASSRIQASRPSAEDSI